MFLVVMVLSRSVLGCVFGGVVPSFAVASGIEVCWPVMKLLSSCCVVVVVPVSC